LGFKIIAVIGYNNDWCAYRGLTDWSDERCAAQGDKISKDAAEALFYAPVARGTNLSRMLGFIKVRSIWA